jgi:hypothetical protein
MAAMYPSVSRRTYHRRARPVGRHLPASARPGSCYGWPPSGRRMVLFWRGFGAVMYPTSHEGLRGQRRRRGTPRVWALQRGPVVVQGGALVTARPPCEPHIRRDSVPNHGPAFGTGELQEGGTTLCRRRSRPRPDNGNAPWIRVPKLACGSGHRLDRLEVGLIARVEHQIGRRSPASVTPTTDKPRCVGVSARQKVCRV